MLRLLVPCIPPPITMAQLTSRTQCFSHHCPAGGGLVFWHPKGARVRHVIENFWKDLHLARGYELVYSPHIAKVGVGGNVGVISWAVVMLGFRLTVQGERLRAGLLPTHCKGGWVVLPILCAPNRVKLEGVCGGGVIRDGPWNRIQLVTEGVGGNCIWHVHMRWFTPHTLERWVGGPACVTQVIKTWF